MATRDEVELGVQLGGGRASAVDLVVEHRRGEVEVDGPLPRRAAPGRAAPVDDDHREALVGEPLRRQVRRLGAHAPAGRAGRRTDRAAPGSGRSVVQSCGQQHGGGQAARARAAAA